MAGLSIFIERQSRRSELALYTLPRAADSLFMIMLDHKFAAALPYGEVLLFCMACSGLVYFFYEHPHYTMSPFVSFVLKLLLRQQSKAEELRDLSTLRTTPIRGKSEGTRANPPTLPLSPSAPTLAPSTSLSPTSVTPIPFHIQKNN